MNPPRATVREVAPGPAARGAARAPSRPRPPAAASRSNVQTFFAREVGSISHALAGIRHAWRTQPHLRIHAAVAAIVVGAGLMLSLAAWEWAILLVLITLVIALELANTAIEALVDLVSPAQHPLAKIAKDTAAAAVLCAAIGAAVTGVIVFGARILALR